MLIAGFDIGGTKCATVLARVDDGQIAFISRREIATAGAWRDILGRMADNVAEQLAEGGFAAGSLAKVGVSCGSPLDSKRGMILSPPNLPGWDNVPVCAILSERFGVPAGLANDADACAVAEWKFGAGRGFDNVVFITFGTGFGAGLILGGRLHAGPSGTAGEIGHVRLSDEGPVGYGKRGSFEGFCSGGGIAQQARTYFTEKLQMGEKPALCPDFSALSALTAKSIVQAADKGDADAAALLADIGRHFGRSVSMLIDLLNPEVIVAGGVYMRGCRHLEGAMREVIAREALRVPAAACKILPSELGEKIGDYGAIAAAMLGCD